MNTVVIDSLGAWRCVVGGFIANFILGGLAKAYGMIVEAYQEVFESGAAPLLLAGGLIYTLMYSLSIVNHFASKRFGSRVVVAVGAIGSFLSLIGTAYSPNIPTWIFCVGIGLGASFSCIYFTVFSVVGQCFRRHLGLANGVAVAGVSVGQMAFPAIINALNVRYGARGACLVMAAVCLHLLITALMMPRYVVESREELEGSSAQRKRFWRLRRKNKNQPVEDSTGRHSNGEAISLHQMHPAGDGVGPVDEDQKDDDVKVNGNGLALAPDSGNGMVVAVEDIAKKEDSPGDEDLVTVIDDGALLKKPNADEQNVKKIACSLLALYIVAKSLGDLGDISVSFVAPSHGIKLGFDGHGVSLAIALSGAVDLVTRIVMGCLIDRPFFAGRRGLLLAVIWLVEAVNTLAFSLLPLLADPLAPPSEWPSTSVQTGYFFCFAVHGICSGTAVTLMVIVLSDYVGQDRISHSLAVTMVVLGIIITPGQYGIGLLADKTGNYVLSLQICFALLLLAGFVLLLEHPIRWLVRGFCHGGGELKATKSDKGEEETWSTQDSFEEKSTAVDKKTAPRV